ncbi:MAG: universal stress protein UspA-like protein [Chitinophagaceae bacterium]|nr:universal stress protein UspA-like protein [Chitinophagaceae bacterium]
MKKIVVPTDFSVLSDKALEVAVAISKQTSAEIELLYITDIPYEDSCNTSDLFHEAGINELFVVKSLEDVYKKFDKIINNPKYRGVNFNTKIKTCDVQQNWFDPVVTQHADLIVMGTKGNSSRLPNILNTSHTKEVVMHADCMVLTVKPEQGPFYPSNVLLVTDFTDYSPAFMENLVTLQKKFNFKLHLVYINTFLTKHNNKDTVLKDQENFIKRYHIVNYEFHIDKVFSEFIGILDYVQQMEIDLLVLNTDQRKGIQYWLGNLSEDVIRHSPIPVLTYKAGR